MLYKICVLSAEREESISRFSSSPLPVSFRILKCVPFSDDDDDNRVWDERISKTKLSVDGYIGIKRNGEIGGEGK